MTLWHLLWLYLAGSGFLLLLGALPFVWIWSRHYSSGERVRQKLLFARLWRKLNEPQKWRKPVYVGDGHPEVRREALKQGRSWQDLVHVDGKLQWRDPLAPASAKYEPEHFETEE